MKEILERGLCGMSIVESMLFVIGHTLTCIGIGFALGLAIGNLHNTKK